MATLVYQTADGKTFATEEAAADWEKRCALVRDVQAALIALCGGDYRIVNAVSVAEALMDKVPAAGGLIAAWHAAHPEAPNRPFELEVPRREADRTRPSSSRSEKA